MTEPAPAHSPLSLPLSSLKRGHIVDPHGWTVAQCYGDYADEYALLIVTATNSHAELLAAAREIYALITPGASISTLSICSEKLKAAIAIAEKDAL